MADSWKIFFDYDKIESFSIDRGIIVMNNEIMMTLSQWRTRNYYKSFKKKEKSKCNPKRKDAAIEIHLSRLEEGIFSLDKKLSYSNLTKKERHALYSLRDDTSTIIKEADKGSGVVVWDRERTI